MVNAGRAWRRWNEADGQLEAESTIVGQQAANVLDNGLLIAIVGGYLWAGVVHDYLIISQRQ